MNAFGEGKIGLPASAAELARLLARSADRMHEQANALAHYRKMYERSSALARIGVWECDLADDSLTWTDGVYDLFELPRGSPIERAAIVALYEEESRAEMERLRAQAIATGSSFSLDIRIRTAKGNRRWLHLTADVEREDGRSVRLFGTKQDITAEKAAQEEVRALQAELLHVSRRSAMGAMAATLAHELNQPLAAISNYAAGARRALDDNAGGREAVESGLAAIESCAARASGIIRSFRAMTDGSAVQRQAVDPNPLICDAGTLALAAGSDGVALRYALAEPALLSVDPIQIQQVLINLIRNAIEAVAAAPRREILVATEAANGTLAIRVEDSGPGVPPERLESLFESGISSKPGGMGIGLSVSRTIVEAHGGKIQAANRDGGGAVFRVELPLKAPAARRE